MTAIVDIANRALQIIGTRTSMSTSELSSQNSNEAIQLQLALVPTRRALLRMAPWNCGLKTANLVYITSAPGTPENTTMQTTLWQPGQPAPPWAYEYQYPVDCLRPCSIIPATQTGFSSGIPITTAVTGGASSFWQGPPVKYKIATDTFIPVISVVIAFGGTNYAVGEIITLAATPVGWTPIGAPAQIIVTGAAAGVITSASIINTVGGANSSPSGTVEVIGGSYFAVQANPVAQGSSTGSGTGATFNLSWGSAAPQRVILTNQEFATLNYIQDVLDPNLMDDEFQEAWINVLGAKLAIALTGDKRLANLCVEHANRIIAQARTADANEDLTVNDVTPDWIRFRGIDFVTPYSSPYSGFDWGGLWPVFG
jgi:hypothetical protein